MTDPLQNFPEQTLRWMGEWRVPGLAVAVISRGQPPYLQGFGWRDLDRRLPVTPHTIFPIASATKAFTSLACGLLVDEGRLSWDIPLRKALPGFAMSDPIASEQASLRDLLCHRTGLPRHDLVTYHLNAAPAGDCPPMPITRGGMLGSLRYLEHSRPFRNAFQYTNLGYVAAGCLVGQAGESDLETGWERFVQRRIFDPLGMTHTYPGAPPAASDPAGRPGPLALPYQWREGAFHALPYPLAASGPDPAAPAGSICSTAADLSTWLELHLAAYSRGDGPPLIPARTLREMHTPQIAIPSEPGLDAITAYPEVSDLGYGLGWYTWQYRGRKMVFHGGELDGFKSAASFLPDEGLGVAVLANAHLTVLGWLLTYNLYDRLLGLPELPWTEHLGAQFRPPDRSPQAHPPALDNRIAKNDTILPVAGDYRHPAYGRITITLQDGQHFFRYRGLHLPLLHQDGENFVLYYAAYDVYLPVQFQRDANGVIAALIAPLEPSVAPIVFQIERSLQTTEN